MTPASFAPLLAAARQAARQAHCPYSRFRVGAALLAADGRVFTGCNIENASYGLTICAERVALGKAVSEGVRAFTALALAAGDASAAAPCGACLQALAEFCGPALPVVGAPLSGAAGGAAVRTWTLGELLPHAFALAGPGENRA